MGSAHLARRILLAPALGLGLAVAVAACSSSGSSSPPSSSPTASSSSPAAAAGGTTAAKIKSNWEAFFSGTTDATQKIALLQNGQEFSSIINGQASSELAKSATADVTGVTGITATQATVDYNILMGGSPALQAQHGTAVYQDGTWKVSDKNFCALLALENVKAPMCSSTS
jgi:hypothetical protein